MDRRHFLSAAGTLGAFELLARVDRQFAGDFEKRLHRLDGLSLPQSAADEDFWGWVRSQFSLSTNLINLNNGGVSPHHCLN